MARSNKRPGDVNRNDQLLLAQTDTPGTDHFRRVWNVRCQPCGHEYGLNGSDFHLRKCPRCQGGRPGLELGQV